MSAVCLRFVSFVSMVLLSHIITPFVLYIRCIIKKFNESLVFIGTLCKFIEKKNRWYFSEKTMMVVFFSSWRLEFAHILVVNDCQQCLFSWIPKIPHVKRVAWCWFDFKVEFLWLSFINAVMRAIGVPPYLIYDESAYVGAMKWKRIVIKKRYFLIVEYFMRFLYLRISSVLPPLSSAGCFNFFMK